MNILISGVKKEVLAKIKELVKEEKTISEDCEKEEWGAWKIVSDMLDNPDECGIYPTSECYQKLYDFVCEQKNKVRVEKEEKEENLFDYFQKWEKKYDKLTEDYLRDIKEMSRRFVSNKKFNWDRIDHDTDLERGK